MTAEAPATSRTRRRASQRVIRVSISTSISSEGQRLSPIQSANAKVQGARQGREHQLLARLFGVEGGALLGQRHRLHYRRNVERRIAKRQQPPGITMATARSASRSGVRGEGGVTLAAALITGRGEECMRHAVDQGAYQDPQAPSSGRW